jgi:hypothetical protein
VLVGAHHPGHVVGIGTRASSAQACESDAVSAPALAPLIVLLAILTIDLWVYADARKRPG